MTDHLWLNIVLVTYLVGGVWAIAAVNRAVGRAQASEGLSESKVMFQRIEDQLGVVTAFMMTSCLAFLLWPYLAYLYVENRFHD